VKRVEDKKEWTSPTIVVYGDMTTLTEQVKPKTPGTSDDFQVTGISDP
jgi:hypothetical protein